MIVDLRMARGIDWYALDGREQAEAALWWRSVRLRELHQLGAIDGETGQVKMRAG